MNKLLGGLFTIALAFSLFTLFWPQYQHYQAKKHYHQIAQTAEDLKLSVISCFHQTNDLSKCNNLESTLSSLSNDKNPNIAKVMIKDGEITIFPKPGHGIHTSDTYILTPDITRDGHLSWHVSGTALRKGYL